MSVQMFGENEERHRLEHRDFDELSAAGALSCQQGRGDRVRCGEGAGLVGDDERHIARLAGNAGHQCGDPGLALDDVVVRRASAIRASVEIAVQAGVDDASDIVFSTASGEKPSAAIFCGRMECTKTSALSISFQSASFAPCFLTSSTIERLFLFMPMNSAAMSCERAGPV